MFNGAYSLDELTDGLPEPYKARVYDITAVLHKNGFVRDVSGDLPHALDDRILDRYASQIEFLDYFGSSGASRFEHYRQAKVLAVGSGPMLISLAAALLESGLPRFHVLDTGALPTNLERLRELEAHARRTDPEVYITETALPDGKDSGWRNAIRPFQSVLYVSQEGDLEELRLLLAACRQENKPFLPALCVQHTGLAGPLVDPQRGNSWESAWRRLHLSALDRDPQLHAFSPRREACLRTSSYSSCSNWRRVCPIQTNSGRYTCSIWKRLKGIGTPSCRIRWLADMPKQSPSRISRGGWRMAPIRKPRERPGCFRSSTGLPEGRRASSMSGRKRSCSGFPLPSAGSKQRIR
ncbi:hypothetical protein LJK87_39250 [Paenibacillus sp. P25]|nr:hypothetical protein LJK87_39250 [Paenibacillus sp. P25]